MHGATMVVATVPVSDLDAARAFYGDTLGLMVLWEIPRRSDSRSAPGASCRRSDGRRR